MKMHSFWLECLICKSQYCHSISHPMLCLLIQTCLYSCLQLFSPSPFLHFWILGTQIIIWVINWYFWTAEFWSGNSYLCSYNRGPHLKKKKSRPEVNFPTIFTIEITISVHANGVSECKPSEMDVCLKQTGGNYMQKCHRAIARRPVASISAAFSLWTTSLLLEATLHPYDIISCLEENKHSWFCVLSLFVYIYNRQVVVVTVGRKVAKEFTYRHTFPNL